MQQKNNGLKKLKINKLQLDLTSEFERPDPDDQLKDTPNFVDANKRKTEFMENYGI